LHKKKTNKLNTKSQNTHKKQTKGGWWWWCSVRRSNVMVLRLDQPWLDQWLWMVSVIEHPVHNQCLVHVHVIGDHKHW